MRRWKIARAKQNFSDLVRASGDEPQLIFNRDRLVAAMIDGDSFESYQRWEQRARMPLGDTFRELRRITVDEDYTLPLAPRKDRPNAFAAKLRKRSR